MWTKTFRLFIKFFYPCVGDIGSHKMPKQIILNVSKGEKLSTRYQIWILSYGLMKKEIIGA